MSEGFKTVVGVWPPPSHGKPEKRACLVMIAGDQIGRTFYIDKAETLIGRDGQYDLSINDPRMSRSHARIIKQGRDGIRIKDLGSTNGTFVNSRRVRDFKLGDGDKITVGSTVFKFIHKDELEAEFHDEIYRLASRDGLTGTYNKKYFKELCEKEIQKRLREKKPLTLCLFDIDHFKKINDVHGHPAGDHVLGEIAKLVKSCLRKDDLFARYGGDEFCIFMPDTGAGEALDLVEKIRKHAAGKNFSFETGEIAATISMGIYTYVHGEGASPTLDALMKKADKKLYVAKAGGRNQVAQ